MSQNQNQNNGTIVGTKRVRRATDAKGREKIVLTFGLDKEGNNTLDALIAALTPYKGKQVNFDVRLETKTTNSGSSFDTAFVLIKEMIPKSEGGGTAFVPKNQARTDQVKATAQKIRSQMG